VQGTPVHVSKEQTMQAYQWLATQLSWELRLSDLRRAHGPVELPQRPVEQAKAA
jgi:hypothetical protein